MLQDTKSSLQKYISSYPQQWQQTNKNITQFYLRTNLKPSDMTFLIVSILTPELTNKSIRIDLNPQKTTFDVKKILTENNVSFSKILNWKHYSVDQSIKA